MPSRMNNSAPLSTSSAKNGVSGRDSYGSEPDEATSSFGDLLAQEMGEREASGAASEIDRSARGAGVDLPHEAANVEEENANGGSSSGGDGSRAPEIVERTGDTVDITTLVVLSHGANVPVTVTDNSKADLPCDWDSDTRALVADRTMAETPDMLVSPLQEPEQHSEFAIAQSGRAGVAGPGAVSSAANLAWNMHAMTEERMGETAGAAGIVETAGTGTVPAAETGMALTNMVAPDFPHSMMETRGTQRGKGIRIDMADPEVSALRMESGLQELGWMEAGRAASLAPGPAVEERLAANPAVQASLVPVVERTLAVSAENAVVPDLTGIEPRMGAAGWDQALGQKVLWLLSQQQQVAQLNLNPPDLGPLQVVLKMADDQLSATFVSQQADVRNALEAALPRLKEMMSESGINLSSTTVSSDSSQHQGRFERPNHVHAGGGYRGGDGHRVVPGSGWAGDPVRAGGRGLVDTFA